MHCKFRASFETGEGKRVTRKATEARVTKWQDRHSRSRGFDSPLKKTMELSAKQKFL